MAGVGADATTGGAAPAGGSGTPADDADKPRALEGNIVRRGGGGRSGCRCGGGRRFRYAYLRWRWAVLAFMCFQVLFGAGVIYGWPALESALIDEHVYASSCDGVSVDPSKTPSHHSLCPAQLLKLNTMFVAASWGAQAGGLLGFVLDKAGVRVTISCSSLAVGVGAVLFGLSGNNGLGWDLRVPALTLMGLAGNGLYLAAQALGDLFPDYTQYALFAISACFAPGTLLFLVFHAVEDAQGVRLRTSFLVYGLCQVVLAAISVLVWPARFDAGAVKSELQAVAPPVHAPPPSPSPVESDPQFTAVYATPHKPGGRPARSRRTGSMPLLAPTVHISRPFMELVFDPRFIGQVVFFSVLMLPAQFFIGTAGSQIARVTTDSDTVNDYVRYFNLTYALVSFATPLFGALTSRVGFGWTFAFVNTLFILAFAVVSWAPSVGWFILADALYTVARSLQFSTFFSYIGHEFGFAHIGKLAGIGFMVSAMVSLLQSPLLKLVLGPMNGAYQWGNVLLMAVSACLFVYCGWLVVDERQRRRRGAWGARARSKSVAPPSASRRHAQYSRAPVGRADDDGGVSGAEEGAGANRAGRALSAGGAV